MNYIKWTNFEKSVEKLVEFLKLNIAELKS